MRRLVGLVAALCVALLISAAPALADDGHGHNGWHGKPTYPPSAPSIWITKTEVKVGGTAVVKASGCAPKPWPSGSRNRTSGVSPASRSGRPKHGSRVSGRCGRR